MNGLTKIGECMEILGGGSSSLRKFQLNEIDTSWNPITEPERQALACLLSEENRSELREWYGGVSDLNPFAERFRRYLERCIGERLPLKESSNG
jgi:hypothetical protein